MAEKKASSQNCKYKKDDSFEIEINPLDFSFDDDNTEAKAAPEATIDKGDIRDGMEAGLPPKQEFPKMYIMSSRTVKRRAFSEDSLFKLMDYRGDFKPGNCYHFLSGGDIDAFSYLKYIIRFRRFKSVLVSTWCIGRQELLEIKKYLDDKLINDFHLCLGEIFRKSYLNEYYLLKELQKNKYKIKITTFRNHAKVILAYSEPDYYFVLTSSANFNTNPRTEQTTIQIDGGLYKFYYDFFNNIKSFE